MADFFGRVSRVRNVPGVRFELPDLFAAGGLALLSGEEIDLWAKYESAVGAVGTVPFFAEVFRRFGDASLRVSMLHLVCAWKELPYRSWKEIPHRISGDAPAVHHFIRFACEYLALDAVRLIREDPGVNKTARDVAEFEFTEGGPRPDGEWLRERPETRGVEPRELWRRLADEGAPMRGA